MTANGITHISEGNETEIIPLSAWMKEKMIYNSLRNLKTFKLYLLWKPIKYWRFYVRINRFKRLRSNALTFNMLSHKLFYPHIVTISGILYDYVNVVRKYLLPFKMQQKLRLKEFDKLCKDNNEVLKNEYSNSIKKYHIY